MVPNPHRHFYYEIHRGQYPKKKYFLLANIEGFKCLPESIIVKTINGSQAFLMCSLGKRNRLKCHGVMMPTNDINLFHSCITGEKALIVFKFSAGAGLLQIDVYHNFYPNHLQKFFKHHYRE